MIACGVSGLDIRLALEDFPKLENCIDSIITVATPHQGSMLASLYNNDTIHIEHISRICELLGIRPDSFKELNYENIRKFNEYIQDYQNENRQIYSIGGDTLIKYMHDILIHSSKSLINSRTNTLEINDNDGIFFIDEVEFGDPGDIKNDDKNYHLGNFNADHLDLLA